MLSTSEIKYINALKRKKHRVAEGLFLAEGKKTVLDLLKSGIRIKTLIAGEEWLTSQLQKGVLPPDIDTKPANAKDFSRISSLKTPQQVMALAEIPQHKLTASDLQGNLSLALEDVQDPGNLGTIIRLADWFGIGHILCTPNTVDAFSPKVVQATMGAIASVKIHAVRLGAILPQVLEFPGHGVYGTFADGGAVYAQNLAAHGVVLFGNEGSGISGHLQQWVTHKIGIPHFAAGGPYSDSLNVAVAAAVTIAEFRRQEHYSK